MKKVFVEFKEGIAINVDAQNAIDGFEYRDYDIIPFENKDVMMGKLNKHAREHPFVGSLNTMGVLFKKILRYPDEINFPRSVLNSELISRNIYQTSLKEFKNQFRIDDKPKFIKSVKPKLIHGREISSYFDFHMIYADDCQIWVSDPLDIISEYRCHIHNRKLVYCSNYDGDFRVSPDFSYIDKLIQSYDNPPLAYTIDVAVLADGTTTVVEFNDYWAIGSYGLDSIKYSQMLSDRYSEIIQDISNSVNSDKVKTYKLKCNINSYYKRKNK